MENPTYKILYLDLDTNGVKSIYQKNDEPFKIKNCEYSLEYIKTLINKKHEGNRL